MRGSGTCSTISGYSVLQIQWTSFVLLQVPLARHHLLLCHLLFLPLRLYASFPHGRNGDVGYANNRGTIVLHAQTDVSEIQWILTTLSYFFLFTGITSSIITFPQPALFRATIFTRDFHSYLVYFYCINENQAHVFHFQEYFTLRKHQQKSLPCVLFSFFFIGTESRHNREACSQR